MVWAETNIQRMDDRQLFKHALTRITHDKTKQKKTTTTTAAKILTAVSRNL